MAEGIIPDREATITHPAVTGPATLMERKPRKRRTSSAEEAGYRASDKDLATIEHRLIDIAYNLVALHKLTYDAVHSPEDSELYLLAMREIARSSVRALDAAIRKLSNSPGLGNFADDLANE